MTHRTLKALILPATLLVGSMISAPAAELIGHWKFNEPEGDRVTDHSGLGRHGKIHGSPQRVPGVDGLGLRFRTNDDFVDFGAPIIPENDFSISIWVNCDDVEKQFFLGQYLYAHPRRLDLAVREGAVRIQIDELVDSPKLVEARRWHHLAYTRAGADVRIFLDGRMVATANLPMPVIQSENLMIGKIVVPRQDSFRFTGVLDELKIWNGALDTSAIEREFRSAKRR